MSDTSLVVLVLFAFTSFGLFVPLVDKEKRAKAIVPTILIMVVVVLLAVKYSAESGVPLPQDRLKENTFYKALAACDGDGRPAVSVDKDDKFYRVSRKVRAGQRFVIPSDDSASMSNYTIKKSGIVFLPKDSAPQDPAPPK